MTVPEPDVTKLAARIDAVLPQTQCTRCGFPCCRDYALAIAEGAADFNQCAPGGAAGIVQLAALLGRTPKPLNPANGVEKPREVALIDEDVCIGCTKCIQACPVDAIIGANKLMHTVVAEECSGCELCIPPCPVDCITMVPAVDANAPATAHAAHYRRRYEAHLSRLARWKSERDAELAARKAALQTTGADAVQAAVARARAKRSGGKA